MIYDCGPGWTILVEKGTPACMRVAEGYQADGAAVFLSGNYASVLAAYDRGRETGWWGGLLLDGSVKEEQEP